MLTRFSISSRCAMPCRGDKPLTRQEGESVHHRERVTTWDRVACANAPHGAKDGLYGPKWKRVYSGGEDVGE
jgi:hypothetical protein